MTPPEEHDSLVDFPAFARHSLLVKNTDFSEFTGMGKLDQPVGTCARAGLHLGNQPITEAAQTIQLRDRLNPAPITHPSVI